MSDPERYSKTVGLKVTPSRRAELDKMMVKEGYANMTDFLRAIIREYEESHKIGSTGHVNQAREAYLDEMCTSFRKFLETRLTTVTGKGGDDEPMVV